MSAGVFLQGALEGTSLILHHSLGYQGSVTPPRMLMLVGLVVTYHFL
jgi:hypothetical protein